MFAQNDSSQAELDGRQHKYQESFCQKFLDIDQINGSAAASCWLAVASLLFGLPAKKTARQKNCDLR